MGEIPASIEVKETAQGVAYILPRRDAARGAIALVIFGGIFGGFALLWTLLALWITAGAGQPFFQVCFPLFGLPFLLVGGGIFLHGAKIVWGQTEIEIDATTLQVRDGWPFRRSKERSRGSVRQLAVESRGQFQTAGGHQIIARFEDGSTLRFAAGYSQGLLVPVAQDILDRLKIKGGSIDDGAGSVAIMSSSGGIPDVPKTRPTDVILSSTAGSLGAVGIVIAAIIWNGIVATITTVWYLNDGLSFWLVLVMSIFGGIGLVLLFAAIHQLMAASRMQRPVISLSISPVFIGESVLARFAQVPKRAVKINRVTASVVCRESATYTHGTNTSTVTHDASKQEFVVLEHVDASPLQPLEGEFAIQIPDNAMHSFSAARNSIQWIIETHTDIAGWPDYKHSLTFDVAAQRVQLETNSENTN